MPDAVVPALVPSYDPSKERSDGQRAQAFLALTRLEGSFQRSGQQLDRLEREGTAVRALGNVLQARRGITRREADTMRVAKAFHRAAYTEQLDRFVYTGALLADVARRARGLSKPRGAAGSWTRLLPPRPVVVGIAVDALGNSRRAVSTFGDAADRHRRKAERIRGSHPAAAARQDRLARKYKDMSNRLRNLTEEIRPFKWSTRVQQLFATAPADVLPKSGPTVRTLRRVATRSGGPRLSARASTSCMPWWRAGPCHTCSPRTARPLRRARRQVA